MPTSQGLWTGRPRAGLRKGCVCIVWSVQIQPIPDVASQELRLKGPGYIYLFISGTYAELHTPIMVKRHEGTAYAKSGVDMFRYGPCSIWHGERGLHLLQESVLIALGQDGHLKSPQLTTHTPYSSRRFINSSSHSFSKLSGGEAGGEPMCPDAKVIKRIKDRKTLD